MEDGYVDGVLYFILACIMIFGLWIIPDVIPLAYFLIVFVVAMIFIFLYGYELSKEKNHMG